MKWESPAASARLNSCNLSCVSVLAFKKCFRGLQMSFLYTMVLRCQPATSPGFLPRRQPSVPVSEMKVGATSKTTPAIDHVGLTGT